MIQGKIGKKSIQWKSAPRGKTGEAAVEIAKKLTNVRWVKDSQGIWIETDQGFFGYDVRKSVGDDGQTSYVLVRRNHAEMISSAGFLKAGEDQTSSSGAVKKAAKVKSQMPGKIVRVLVKPGDAVKKGQSLLVMEAMKMENEIKAAQDGVIKEIKVTEGQAIETGAELLNYV